MQLLCWQCCFKFHQRHFQQMLPIFACAPGDNNGHLTQNKNCSAINHTCQHPHPHSCPDWGPLCGSGHGHDHSSAFPQCGSSSLTPPAFPFLFHSTVNTIQCWFSNRHLCHHPSPCWCWLNFLFCNMASAVLLQSNHGSNLWRVWAH